MAGVTVKGAASIEIDALEVQAKLVFAPDKAGADWNTEGILKLFGEKRLSPAPSPRAIEEFLQKAAKSREPLSTVALKGLVPEAPTPERVAWADLPVPADLAQAVRDTLSGAAAPLLYRIITEKIKRETRVKKPSPLPFLPPKEEVIVAWEKIETREQVYVDTTVVDHLYAEKDVKVGLLAPPKPGKPGKSVFGKPVASPPDTAGPFLLGEGLIREKSEIRSTTAGIVRIGRNWADLVPLAKHDWKVEKSVDGTTLLLRFVPGDRRFPPPGATDVLSTAIASGAREEYLIPAAEIEAALAQALRTGTALPDFPLSRKIDAQARVDVSLDKLRALLALRKAVAGSAPLDLKTVSRVIRESGVRGFNAEKVKADILAFYSGPDIELKDYPLAVGKAPTRGKDKEVQVAGVFLPEEKKKELLDRLAANPQLARSIVDQGAFPLSGVTDLALVEKGVKVALVTQPPPGIAGNDVFGAALPGLPGNDPEIKLFKGLQLRGAEIVTDLPGLLLAKRGANAFSAWVLPFKDAAVQVKVATDAMEATLVLEREIGPGKALSAEAVSAALAAAGVVRGIDGAAVAEALLVALERGSCPPTRVAQGEAPVSGGGSAVKWLVNLDVSKGVTIREDGTADFRNQRRFVAATEGLPLAEIIQEGEEGRAGFDVTGKLLDPDKGVSARLDHDETIREQAIDGGVRLMAAKTGELLFDGTTARINSLHGVKGDVGLATGNLKFSGEIRISGKVGATFAVMGGQDVLIGEIVEAALVSADGKIVIGQGILGGGKGIIRARKSIEAAFVEQATLLAVEDIRIKNGCLLSNIKTNGRLILSSEQGNLVGGVCRARLGVEAANIGSERSSRTEISFGQDYLIMDQIEQTERETDKLKKALLDLELRGSQAGKGAGSIEALRAEKVRLLKLLEKYSLRLFTLREKFEEDHGSAIQIRGNVYPGVVMESHGRYYEVKQKRSRVVFYFDKGVGRIQEKPLK